MKSIIAALALMGFLIFPNCKQGKTSQEADAEDFPSEMVDFVPYENNPVFKGTGTDSWDRRIRERGYILIEDGVYKMWYSGYNGKAPIALGYATSKDGINWERNPDNPIFNEKWTEDMFVINHKGLYYMFAEGHRDIAHLMTSSDGINWEERGNLDIRFVNGDPVPGPYGTPVAWIENNKWHLFYERNDEGIWLAVSEDLETWTNIQDDPVIKKGPDEYDVGAVAANQVVKHKGKYYIYYHGSSNPNWATEKALWSSNVAMSTDLVNWVKYPGNPIVEGDHSSPILVFDDGRYHLYTMHDQVWLYLPKK